MNRVRLDLVKCYRTDDASDEVVCLVHGQFASDRQPLRLFVLLEVNGHQ